MYPLLGMGRKAEDVEAMISWESSSVLTACARLATSVESEQG